MPERIIYTGHFVEDQDALLELIPPLIKVEGTKLHAHHVTREFKPSDGVESITPGKKRVLFATGQVAAEGVHAVLVQAADGEQISLKESPHITIATAPGVSPVKSDEIIASAKEAGTIVPIEPPIQIETVEGYFNGKHVITS